MNIEGEVLTAQVSRRVAAIFRLIGAASVNVVRPRLRSRLRSRSRLEVEAKIKDQGRASQRRLQYSLDLVGRTGLVGRALREKSSRGFILVRVGEGAIGDFVTAEDPFATRCNRGLWWFDHFLDSPTWIQCEVATKRIFVQAFATTNTIK